MNKIIYKIFGMHCKSCEILIEDKLKEICDCEKILVDNKKEIAEIYYSKEKPNEKVILKELDKMGYKLIGEEKEILKTNESKNIEIISKNKNDYYEIFLAIIISASLYMIFSMLKLENLFTINSSSSSISYGSSILMGITAGLSTCMALVGGLIMSISAKFSESNQNIKPIEKFKPHLFFNIGRVIGFFILGGVLGIFGSVFQISLSFTGFFTILVALVMLLLGLQLTGLFPILSKINFTLPKSISRFFGITDNKRYSHKGTILLGALTFFLPCGFTQAMQIYAVSSGDFISGALIMSLFAIGTTPGLMGVAGLTSFIKGKYSGIFFKTISIIVLIFASINFSNGYNLFLTKNDSQSNEITSSCLIKTDGDKACSLDNVNTNDTQIIKADFNVKDDITPTIFRVNNNKPVRFEINASENGAGCMSTIMIPSLFNKPKYIEKGLNVLNFTPTKTGSYPIVCAMGVKRGTLIVQ